MPKSQFRLIGFILPLVLVGLVALAPAAFAQKHKDRTEPAVYTPPTLEITASPSVVTVCADDSGAATGRVQLNAKSDFSGSPRYKWSVSGGRLDGEGANPTWDLSGQQPGYYKAFVEAGTTEECVAFSSVTILVVKCEPRPPACPNIVISCPDKVGPNQPLTFSASVAGGTSGIAQVYNWTVSAGRITSGEGTNTITVDTTGLAGQTVKATLVMTGYGALNCSASCQVQIQPELPNCRKFDEFAAISRNDEKARLDNYGIEIQADPTSTAYIIVYPGQKGKPGEAQQRITHMVDYLVNTRGIDRRRVVTLIGPARAEFGAELWTCPQGARPPMPKAN
jgi:hypothetical protein